jgi:UDP-glucose 4-epimerase
MNSKFKRACVTGGAGFIGSKLARQLLEHGLEVRVLDNLSVGRLENIPRGARFIQGDILNSSDCEQALEGCDVLFHMAARVAIRASFEFVVEDTLCNVTGTATVLRSAVRSGTVRKVIAASSMGVYADSPTPTPMPETHPTEPLSPYGISKLALEMLTHRIAAAAGLDSVALRIFNAYGPGQRFSPYVGVITIFVNQLRAGQSPTIFGDGQQVRDFVHVADVASGFVAAMQAPVTGETINIASGRAHTVQQVYDTLARELQTGIAPTYVPAVPGELRNVTASIEKARRLLSYEPAHEFESSIPAVIGEILQQSAKA